MSPIVKYTEAIHDRTIEDAGLIDHGIETVLVDEIPSSSSGLSKSDTVLEEEVCDMKLLEMIQEGQWVELSQLVATTPRVCRARFTTALSTDNLLLHEACKTRAPLWFVDAVVRSNKDAITKKGYAGYLPLHFACANGASADVIAFLLGEFPGSIHMVENNERMLPLHLASKHCLSEDSMMVLLSSFPEAIMVKDAFGRTPLDFAKNQSNAALRNTTISYLDRGNWLCSASAAARHWAELVHHKQMEEFEEKMKKAVDQLELEHQEEKTELEEKVSVLEALVSQKQENIDSLEQTIEQLKAEITSGVDREHQSLAALQYELELKGDELKTIQSKLTETELKYANEKKQLEESHKASFDEIMVKYETDKAELTDLISCLRDESEARQNQIIEQADQIERFKKQGAESDQNLKVMVDQIATLQKVLDDNKATLERTNKRLVRATIRNSELNSQLQIKESELHSAVDTADELRQQVEHLTSILTSIRHLSGAGSQGVGTQPWHTTLSVNSGSKNSLSPVRLESSDEQFIKPETMKGIECESESRSEDGVFGEGESMIVSSRE